MVLPCAPFPGLDSRHGCERTIAICGKFHMRIAKYMDVRTKSERVEVRLSQSLKVEHVACFKQLKQQKATLKIAVSCSLTVILSLLPGSNDEYLFEHLLVVVKQGHLLALLNSSQ